LAAGSPLSLTVDAASDLGLSDVVIVPSMNVSQGTVVILKVDTTPISSLQFSSGKVYQSFQINSTGGINDSSLQNASLNFKIAASWFKANGLDPATVVVYRNADNTLGSWTALNTSLTSYDNTTYYFTAVSPGFSTYSVYANSSICSVGETRCFAGNVVQACLSNDTWTDNQTCDFGCGNGLCLSERTTSAGMVLYYVLGAVLVLIIAFLILLGAERGAFKTLGMRIKKMFGKQQE
jgi:PGF-pre-PGF domain-containing protein